MPNAHYAPIYHYRPRQHWRITVNTKPYYPKVAKPQAAKPAKAVHAPAAKALRHGSKHPASDSLTGCRMPDAVPDAGCRMLESLPPVRPLALPSYAPKISLAFPPSYGTIEYKGNQTWQPHYFWLVSGLLALAFICYRLTRG